MRPFSARAIHQRLLASAARRARNAGPGKQSGFLLLEVLVAIVIFSIAILGFVAFRTTAVREVSEAKIRADASFLVETLISEMWANRPNLASYNASCDAAPALLSTWCDAVRDALPGAASLPATVAVGPADGRVDIMLRWRLAGSGEVHQYKVTTLLVDP